MSSNNVGHIITKTITILQHCTTLHLGDQDNCCILRTCFIVCVCVPQNAFFPIKFIFFFQIILMFFINCALIFKCECCWCCTLLYFRLDGGSRKEVAWFSVCLLVGSTVLFPHSASFCSVV